MTRCVVDASIAVKWFVPEAHSEAALQLLSPAYELMAPDLFFPETGNVLWKKVVRQEITPKEAAVIWRDLQRSPVRLYPSSPILGIALEMAIARHQTVYDCLYLSLAMVQHCRMVTANKRFYQALLETPLARHLQWIES